MSQMVYALPSAATAKAGNAAAQNALLEQLSAELGDEVHQMLVKGGEPGLTESTLRRWLVARKWILADAVKDLKAHAEWRMSYSPNGSISAASIATELGQRKAFLQGCDSYGHPVALVMASRHIPQKDNDECKRFIAFSLDAADRLGAQNPLWDGKSVGIFDLQGMTLQNYDVAALRAVFDLLQNHYPERLAKMYLYCAPMIFYGLWKIVSAFVDPVTKEKVQFVYKDAETAAIFARDFPAGVLPPELGGVGTWRPVDVAAQELLRMLPNTPPAARYRTAATKAAAVCISPETPAASTL